MSFSNIFKKNNLRNTRLFSKIPKINKFAFFLAVFVFLAFTNHQIFADLPSSTVTDFINKQDAFTRPNNQESWISSSASSNTMILINALVGHVDENVLNGTDTTSWVPNGIIGLTNQGISFLYTPPISGVQYIAQTVNNFLGKPAYAAIYSSTGFSGLVPLWRGFRNVTYTIFSLFFIITGIMIMLRVKISQQAVVTIQSAIPKLITSLILVTFSYAIVGLLIDLSYLIESLGISLILKASSNNLSVSEIIADPNVSGRILDLVPLWGITIMGATIGGILALIPAVGPEIGLIAFGIIFLVIILIILFHTVNFFFGLLKCYISILIKTIVGPLEIALGAIPNMKMGFGSWFVDILANILVFPISMIFLFMVKAIMEAVKNSDNLWTPAGLEFFSGGGMLSVAIGLGALMLVSKLPKMIPELIFQIKPSPWGKAIGEGFDTYNKYGSRAAKIGRNDWLETHQDIDHPNEPRGLSSPLNKLWKMWYRESKWK